MDASSHARATHRPGRGRVFDSIVDAIGNTLIVRLRRLPRYFVRRIWSSYQWPQVRWELQIQKPLETILC